MRRSHLIILLFALIAYARHSWSWEGRNLEFAAASNQTRRARLQYELSKYCNTSGKTGVGNDCWGEAYGKAMEQISKMEANEHAKNALYLWKSILPTLETQESISPAANEPLQSRALKSESALHREYYCYPIIAKGATNRFPGPGTKVEFDCKRIGSKISPGLGIKVTGNYRRSLSENEHRLDTEEHRVHNVHHKRSPEANVHLSRKMEDDEHRVNKRSPDYDEHRFEDDEHRVNNVHHKRSPEANVHLSRKMEDDEHRVNNVHHKRSPEANVHLSRKMEDDEHRVNKRSPEANVHLSRKMEDDEHRVNNVHHKRSPEANVHLSRKMEDDEHRVNKRSPEANVHLSRKMEDDEHRVHNVHHKRSPEANVHLSRKIMVDAENTYKIHHKRGVSEPSDIQGERSSDLSRADDSKVGAQHQQLEIIESNLMAELLSNLMNTYSRHGDRLLGASFSIGSTNDMKNALRILSVSDKYTMLHSINETHQIMSVDWQNPVVDRGSRDLSTIDGETLLLQAEARVKKSPLLSIMFKECKGAPEMTTTATPQDGIAMAATANEKFFSQGLDQFQFTIREKMSPAVRGMGQVRLAIRESDSGWAPLPDKCPAF